MVFVLDVDQWTSPPQRQSSVGVLGSPLEVGGVARRGAAAPPRREESDEEVRASSQDASLVRFRAGPTPRRPLRRPRTTCRNHVSAGLGMPREVSEERGVCVSPPQTSSGEWTGGQVDRWVGGWVRTLTGQRSYKNV